MTSSVRWARHNAGPSTYTVVFHLYNDPARQAVVRVPVHSA